MNIHLNSAKICKEYTRVSLRLALAGFYLIFHRYEGFLSDYSPVGTLATTLKATDKDEGIDGQLVYEVTSGNEGATFELHQTSNSLVQVLLAFSPVKPGTYELTVRVRDKGHTPMNDTTLVRVHVANSTMVDCSEDVYGK